MIPTRRQRVILNKLKEKGAVENVALYRELEISPMTLWRDLRQMEKQGQLKRVRGGAVPLFSQSESQFTEKQAVALKEKRKIAGQAAAMVGNGDTLFLEGGTTVGEMIDQIRADGITLITNSLPLLAKAHSRRSGWCLLATGGQLNPISGNFTGPKAIRFIADMHADWFFASATGYDAESGIFTDPNPMEIEIKQAMAARAEKKIMLIDSSKVGVKSLQQVFHRSDLDRIVSHRDFA